MKRRTLIILLSVIVLAGIIIVIEIIPRHANVVFYNGIIYTMSDRIPVASAVAVSDGKIVGVGSSEKILSTFHADTLIDLQGKTIVPGFIDSHAHFLNLGLALMNVDLRGVESPRQAAERVALAASSRGEGLWVTGRGWDQNLWEEKKYPTAPDLDSLISSKPVLLSRVDGHAVWVNSAALQIAGITAATVDPPGGKIVRDAKGNPMGVLIDAAVDLVALKIPPPTIDDLKLAAKLASQACAESGITTVHDMGVDSTDIRVYKELIDSDSLHTRIYAAIGGAGSFWSEMMGRGPLVGYGNNFLTVRAVKLYMDGALGSRGAALFDEYSDDPGNRGLTMMSDDELKHVIVQALGAGFQVCIHAIGDRGNHLALNAYEEMLIDGTHRDVRFRIEHAQVLAPEDIPRFKKIGILPCMQPTHCTSDMYWAEARLGSDRVRGAYAWRSLLRTGVIIPGGSDFPVEYPVPLYGIYAAVTRRDQQGKPASAPDIEDYFSRAEHDAPDTSHYASGWFGSERMTRGEALRSFTVWAAKAGFEEYLKGTIERGKLADLVVLDKDPFTVPEADLYSIRVLRTIVDGRTVYSAPNQ